ncbi:alpha-hydroxy acid oxidase [Comamonas sp. J-3]|uniref:alpha-hydroxy acid oxidase n=1 Tax=Comamonas trifloxystrobinivorans TaxID=3350256 RepID=UPI0037279CA4
MPALDQYLSIADLERVARRRMPACVRGYVCGGTEDGASLQESLQAFQRLGFVPRGLRNVEKRSTAASLWGQTYALPMGFAPTGFSAIVMKECDAALAKVARQEQLPFIISGASTVPLERLQQENGQRCWYQAYLPGNMARILPLLQRLEQAQIEVLVITIDTCVGANRENLQRLKFTVPFRPSFKLLVDGLCHPRWSTNVFLKTVLSQGIPRFANLAHEMGPAITADPPNGFRGERDKLDWDCIDQIRAAWKGKLVLKGLMHPDDARLAVAHGADAVVVSTHGGRQLDACISPLQALPEIRSAVPADFPVFIDGGFRRGTDVLKAIALGANLVFTGRPQLYGAAVAGEAGIAHAVHIFRQELMTDMALLGVSQPQELNANWLRLNGDFSLR